MPRPFRTRTGAACVAVAVCCAALGPSALHAALAAAAGTLFEAAPFVLVAEALPKKLGLRTLAALSGCSCGAAVPGALSLVAIGLCWLTFGPAIALARSAAGVALLCCRRPFGPDRGADPADAFSQLLALAPSAAAAGVLANVVASHAGTLSATPPEKAAALALGLVLGALAPCGTAAVAIAAALRPHLPFAAAGILATGGLVPHLVLFRGGYDRSGPDHRHDDAAGHEQARENASAFFGKSQAAASRPAYVARIAMSLALGMLALGGPRGFVNPRLVPLEGLAAAIALAGMTRESGAGAIVVPAILWLALAAGSPEPAYVANETRLDDAFAGERVAFTGVAHGQGSRTIVQRFAITCCRVDASAIAVRTTARLPVADGTWIRTAGVFIDTPSGLLLRPNAWHAVPPPADPFVYR